MLGTVSKPAVRSWALHPEVPLPAPSNGSTVAPQSAGSVGLFVEYVGGHLGHHPHAAHPHWSPLQSHLGVFRGIKLWLSVTKENDLFLGLQPKQQWNTVWTPISCTNSDKTKGKQEKRQREPLMWARNACWMVEQPMLQVRDMQKVMKDDGFVGLMVGLDVLSGVFQP